VTSLIDSEKAPIRVQGLTVIACSVAEKPIAEVPFFLPVKRL